MIDTHLHLWRLDNGWYGWNTPDLGAVHADSTVGDIADAMDRHGVTAAVAVQAADTLAETDWLLSQAAHEPRLAGVVGYLPVGAPAELEAAIAAYAGTALVGVRRLWHDLDHPGELATPASVRGLRLLGEAGLPVDVPDAHPALWPALYDAVRQAPATTFVIDHCGKPPFGRAAAWTDWERAIREVAGRQHVIVKLSGLFGGSGSASPATDDELARVVALTREVAGAERTMIGSDWPMTRGRLDYGQTMARLDRLLAGWSATEREQALTGTARTVYRLG